MGASVQSSSQPLLFSVIALVVSVVSFVRTIMIQRQALVLPHFKSKWNGFSQRLGWTVEYWNGFELQDDRVNIIPEHAETPMLDEVAQAYSTSLAAYLGLHQVLVGHAVRNLDKCNDMVRSSDGMLKTYDDLLQDMGDQDAEWIGERVGRDIDRELFAKKHLGEHITEATTGQVRASTSYQREFRKYERRVSRVLPLIRFLSRRLVTKKRFYDAVFAAEDDREQ